jgi:hypothetical protein
MYPKAEWRLVPSKVPEWVAFHGVQSSSEVQRILVEANEDCIEIEHYRLPKHAKAVGPTIEDGGSGRFVADHYIIFLRMSLFPLLRNPGSVFAGYSYGYELYLISGELWEDASKWGSPVVSKVWFVTSEHMRQVSGGFAKQLKQRKGEPNQPLVPTPGDASPRGDAP